MTFENDTVKGTPLGRHAQTCLGVMSGGQPLVLRHTVFWQLGGRAKLLLSRENTPATARQERLALSHNFKGSGVLLLFIIIMKRFFRHSRERSESGIHELPAASLLLDSRFRGNDVALET